MSSSLSGAGWVVELEVALWLNAAAVEGVGVGVVVVVVGECVGGAMLTGFVVMEGDSKKMFAVT